MIAALFGGTFDPVHAGHVALVRHVMAAGLAERVQVVPNWRSPWRDEPVAAAPHRLAMCRLAFAGVAGAVVDPFEIEGGHPAWTVDTLEHLTDSDPETRWRVVIGGDQAAAFPRWRRPGRILELAELLVVDRGGGEDAAAALAAAGFAAARIRRAPDFDHPVSGTAVRAMLARGSDPGDALPPGVAGYIAAQGLYRGA